VKTVPKDVEERRARQIERLLTIASDAHEATDKVAAERLLSKIEATEAPTKSEIAINDGLELLTVPQLKQMLRDILGEVENEQEK